MDGVKMQVYRGFLSLFVLFFGVFSLCFSKMKLV